MLTGHFVVPVEAGLAGAVLLAVHLGLSTWEAFGDGMIVGDVWVVAAGFALRESFVCE
jgi:hypothetical protein